MAPPAYLDAPSKHAGCHLLVEVGILLTIADEVSQLSD